MNNETLDRMIEAMTDALGIDAFSLADVNIQDARRGMLAALRAMWRPIEEAPKDGTQVLVHPSSLPDAMSAARYYDHKYAPRPKPYWQRSDCGTMLSRDKPPTHFAPLLPGPEE